jgi:type IV secretory pathway VirB2 component (pilin)
VGSIVAVVILAIYGVQWFLASPQQKAILKEKAFAYIIGAALVFGGATIMGWIGDTFANAVR